ncbi:helix-turn-helix domain-containing protein [Brachybacterium sp. ACRRE]|uniref:helix-turn-helix domain-containing protein n=1 Tax=Brachybacterium sp. ACRRE TaxID=2918184 RepID=UPI001EF27E99|nr:XRE family transcriptional regulator [Brachybacterium sp. ACRRE]MCG7311277.1 XRE family transcriptional regulator [Brachybacterium sp. ACRRE]
MTSRRARRLGPAIRARRAELGITLHQLSEATGVSRGTLSRIENNTLSTSLANALAIASALSVDLSELLDEPESQLVRAEDATRYTDASGITRITLAQPSPGIQLLRYEVPAGAASTRFAAHRGRTQEVLHILEGRLVFETEGDSHESHELGAGDTFTVRADREHRLSNPGEEPCILHMLTVSPR